MEHKYIDYGGITSNLVAIYMSLINSAIPLDTKNALPTWKHVLV